MWKESSKTPIVTGDVVIRLLIDRNGQMNICECQDIR